MGDVVDDVVDAGFCGDGILDGAEECDDGNLDDGDGCSSCTFADGGESDESSFVTGGDITNALASNRSADCTTYANDYFSSVTNVHDGNYYEGDVKISVSDGKCIFASNAIQITIWVRAVRSPIPSKHRM